MLFLLYRGNYLGWRVSTPIWVAGGGLLATVALLIWRELVAPDPFLHLGAFSSRTVALTMFASAFWCAALYGVSIQLPDCLLALGYEHWKVGWVILPMCLIAMASMFLGGFVRHRGLPCVALPAGPGRMTVVGLWLAADRHLHTLAMGDGRLEPVGRLRRNVHVADRAAHLRRPSSGIGRGHRRDEVLHAVFQRYGGHLDGRRPDRTGRLVGAGPRPRRNRASAVGAVQADEPGIRDYLVRHGSTPAEAVAQAEAVLDQWVQLHSQVIGYRIGLRFCAYLSAAGLIVSCFISRRKEPSIFDAS